IRDKLVTGVQTCALPILLGRQKDIQYASRADSHIARQKQIHHLRHVISELAALLPPEVRESMHCRDLTSWGCRTTMHVVRLLAQIGRASCREGREELEAW